MDGLFRIAEGTRQRPYGEVEGIIDALYGGLIFANKKWKSGA